MIDPKSLRKGNWVQHNGTKRIIEEIGKFRIDLCGDFDGEIYIDVPFDELEGIDLSPEILTDFGFEEVLGHIHEARQDLQLQRHNYRKTIIKDDESYRLESLSNGGWAFNGVKLPADPRHVHELPNLFYFMMHEEPGFVKHESCCLYEDKTLKKRNRF